MTDHTPAHVAAWRYVITHGVDITPEHVFNIVDQALQAKEEQ